MLKTLFSWKTSSPGNIPEITQVAGQIEARLSSVTSLRSPELSEAIEEGVRHLLSVATPGTRDKAIETFGTQIVNQFRRPGLAPNVTDLVGVVRRASHIFTNAPYPKDEGRVSA